LVENETAPEPWKSGRCGADVPGLIAVRERDLVAVVRDDIRVNSSDIEV
jgi:hypothetical protein